MIKAIVYTSDTGYTKTYAELLEKELELPLYSLNEALKELDRGDEIIYLGWVMADVIQGYKKAEENFKINNLCAVGLSATGTRVVEIKNANNIIKEKLFTLQGGLDLNKLKGLKKVMIKIIRKSMIKKLEEKVVLNEEDKNMLAILKMEKSGVSIDNLKNVIEHLRSANENI